VEGVQVKRLELIRSIVGRAPAASDYGCLRRPWPSQERLTALEQQMEEELLQEEAELLIAWLPVLSHSFRLRMLMI